MSDSLQTAAIEIAQKAFEEHTVEKDVAQYIKKEFDRSVRASETADLFACSLHRRGTATWLGAA